MKLLVLFTILSFNSICQQIDTTWINDSVRQVTITYGEMNRKEFRLAKLKISADLKKAELEIEGLKIQSKNAKIRLRNERIYNSERLDFVSDSLKRDQKVKLDKQGKEHKETVLELKNKLKEDSKKYNLLKKQFALEKKKERKNRWFLWICVGMAIPLSIKFSWRILRKKFG